MKVNRHALPLTYFPRFEFGIQAVFVDFGHKIVKTLDYKIIARQVIYDMKNQ